ncbi:MAG: ACT domain-containing protein [Gaiellaceae bacterium]
MPTDLTVRLVDRPGAMAGACEALGDAGINIDGCCAYPAGDAGQLHLLVEDAEAAREALRAAGYEIVQDRKVIVHELEDVPGSAGAALRRIADAGVNLQLVYMATATRLVLGVDDLDAARAAL